ncbi:MAG: hypothetical protein ROY99_04080 [Ignavibacterium sp.]|jgi:hypothetical protein|nr:hypothetical protein [Ignavibacterium sp.]
MFPETVYQKEKVLTFLSIFDTKIEIIIGLDPGNIADIFRNYIYSPDSHVKKQLYK